MERKPLNGCLSVMMGRSCEVTSDLYQAYLDRSGGCRGNRLHKRAVDTPREDVHSGFEVDGHRTPVSGTGVVKQVMMDGTALRLTTIILHLHRQSQTDTDIEDARVLLNGVTCTVSVTRTSTCQQS